MSAGTMPDGDTTWFKPYDPKDSPGPIPNVAERFRRRAIDKQEARARAVVELARYTLVLITPPDAGRLGLSPEQAGLMLYVDDLQDGCRETFEDAVRDIEEYSGHRVALVEHHADLAYWTVRPR
jgi:hypothetical protein